MTDHDELSKWAEDDMTLPRNSTTALRGADAAAAGRAALDAFGGGITPARTAPRLDPGQFTALPKALLELLIARHRLGHDWWTIQSDRQTSAALGALSRDGWVEIMHGIMPRTVRVRIPAKIWTQYTIDHDHYVPPILSR